MQQFALPVSNPDLQAQITAVATALTQLVGLTSHVMVGLTTAHGLEAVKNTGVGGKLWAALPTKRVKNIVTAVLALLGSLGITVAMTGYDSHTGNMVIAIGGLTSQSIWTHLGGFIESWVSQRTAYVTTVRPTAVTAVEPTIGAPAPAPVPVHPV